MATKLNIQNPSQMWAEKNIEPSRYYVVTGIPGFRPVITGIVSEYKTRQAALMQVARMERDKFCVAIGSWMLEHAAFQQ